MIKYNLRYRGPFEYDKFILSILQYSNEVKYLQSSIQDGELNLLSSDNNDLDALFNKLTKENGLMQKILQLSMRVEQRGLSSNGNQ